MKSFETQTKWYEILTKSYEIITKSWEIQAKSNQLMWFPMIWNGNWWFGLDFVWFGYDLDSPRNHIFRAATAPLLCCVSFIGKLAFWARMGLCPLCKAKKIRKYETLSGADHRHKSSTQRPKKVRARAAKKKAEGLNSVQNLRKPQGLARKQSFLIGVTECTRSSC